MEHRNSPEGEQHPIANWVVASVAERDLLQVTYADIGKVCRVRGAQHYALAAAEPAEWETLVTGNDTASTAAELETLYPSSSNTRVLMLLRYSDTIPTGGGTFRWNADGVVATNGGTIFKPDAVLPGNWERVQFSNIFNVQDFGAAGLNVDDTAGILAAVAAAATNAYAAVYFPPGTYNLTDSIPLHSGVTYYGTRRSIIRQTTENKPIMASAGWINAASPSGHVEVRDLRLQGGAGAGSNNHGIVLRDYYSAIRNVRISSTGGDAIHITHLSSNATAVGSTLVENRIESCDISNPVGNGIYIGELDNNKLTDGFVTNCTVDCTATSPYGVYIGSGAGWVVDNVHTYGTPTECGVLVANAYHTKVDGVYVEDYTTAALSFPRIQRALSLDNVTVKAEVAGTAAVQLDKSAAVSSAHVSISNLNVVNNSANAVTAIKSLSSAVYINLGAHQLENKSTGSITLLDHGSPTRVRRMTDAVVDGSMRDSPNNVGLVYGGSMVQAFSAHRRIEAVNPAAEITETFAIGKINDYRSMSGLLTLKLRANYNGTVRATYCGMLHIQAKDNGTDAWVASLDTIIAAAGLSAGPTATIADAGDGTGTLTVKFTPTNTDAYGAMTLVLSASESAA